jgi:uncharacterized membrane protein
MEWQWIVGVLLAATGSIISNLGLNLQKLQHVRAASAAKKAADSSASSAPDGAGVSSAGADARTGKGASTPQPYFRQPLWIFGLSLVILGSFGDFAALAFASQSTVAPLGSLTLVTNVLFAPLLLGEPISRWDCGGTMIIVLGCTLAIAGSPKREEQFDRVWQLQDLFLQRNFVVYAAFVTASFFGLVMFGRHSDRLRKHKRDEYPRYELLHRFVSAAAAGVIGAQSVLFGKCAAELLVIWAKGDNPFLHALTYFVIFMLFFTIFLQIRFLNKALMKFEAMVVVPIFQSFWMVVSVISGMVFFGEYKQLLNETAPLFGIGVFVTIVGLVVLSQRKNHGASFAATPIHRAEVAPINGLGSPSNSQDSSASDTQALLGPSATDDERRNSDSELNRPLLQPLAVPVVMEPVFGHLVVSPASVSRKLPARPRGEHGYHTIASMPSPSAAAVVPLAAAALESERGPGTAGGRTPMQEMNALHKRTL